MFSYYIFTKIATFCELIGELSIVFTTSRKALDKQQRHVRSYIPKRIVIGESAMLTTDENYENLSIKKIIEEDIKSYAKDLNITPRQLIKDFAKNTNIVFRTLERFFAENNDFTPHVRTVVDIYTQIYKTTSLAEIISKAHPKISDLIKKNHTQCILGGENVSELAENPAAQAKLTSSSVFNEIYFMTSGDYGTDISKIRNVFGSRGLGVLDEMIKTGFVEIDENDLIKRKKKLAWDNKIRKNFLQTLVFDVYKEENSDMMNPNYVGVAMGDVTPADYQVIREKMMLNYNEILDIIKKSKPTYDEAIRVGAGKILEVIDFKPEGPGGNKSC